MLFKLNIWDEEKEKSYIGFNEKTAKRIYVTLSKKLDYGQGRPISGIGYGNNTEKTSYWAFVSFEGSEDECKNLKTRLENMLSRVVIGSGIAIQVLKISEKEIKFR